MRMNAEQHADNIAKWANAGLRQAVIDEIAAAVIDEIAAAVAEEREALERKLAAAQREIEVLKVSVNACINVMTDDQINTAQIEINKRNAAAIRARADEQRETKGA
jgi:hypothetical protein